MNSLSRQMLSQLVVPILFLLLIWSTLVYQEARKQADLKVFETRENVAARLAYNLVDALWNVSEKRAFETLRFEAANEDMQALLVYDEAGKYFAGLLRMPDKRVLHFDPESPAHNSLLKSLPDPKALPVLRAQQGIGRVAVYVDSQKIRARAQRSSLIFFVQVAVLVCVLALLTYAGLRRQVLRPLAALGAWVKGVQPGSPTRIPQLGSTLEFAELASSFTEMTERLKSSEEWQRVLFETSRYAFVTIDPATWRFTSANQSALKAFGVNSLDALIASDLFRFSPEYQPDGQSSRVKGMIQIQEALDEGHSYFEWMHRRANGDEFPSTIMLTRLETRGKTLLHATVHDQTEVEALKAKMAEGERMASLGLLAAGVAHEINNPLAYVLLNIESIGRDLKGLGQALLRARGEVEKKLGPEQAARQLGDFDSLVQEPGLGSILQRVKDIDEAARRMRDVVKGLNSFARLDSSELLPVDLAQAVENAARLAHNEIKFRARLTLELPPLPLVRASSGKLVQVVLNLLINAAHAIPEGHPESHSVAVRAWREDGRVLLEVRDSGSGIAPKDLEKIWEPFYTTKQAGMGTGLGLAISRSIIESFDGEISVQSQLGQGSIFTVALQIDTRAPQAQASKPEAQGLRGRVLIIDDESGLRRALTNLLGRDHEVLALGAQDEILSCLEQDRRFDVILCDMMMPGMSGIEIYEWLKARDSALAERMVFMTGGAFSPAALKFLEGRTVIEKPVEGEKLRQKVFEKIAAHRQG